MDSASIEKLFYSKQDELSYYNKNKFKVKAFALTFTLVPVFFAYGFYYNDVFRRKSFVLQGLVIYSIYRYLVNTFKKAKI